MGSKILVTKCSKADHKRKLGKIEGQSDIRSFIQFIPNAKRLKVEPENPGSGEKEKCEWGVKWWETKKKETTDVKEKPNSTLQATSVPKRRCPFYKIIPNTAFAVDAFSYGDIPDVKNYFLSHFHSDHYQGLNKKFQKPIYCSKVTANLVRLQLRVSEKHINPLPLNESNVVGNTKVVLLEANHCPGAVMFLFTLANGRVILHTGDFRADSNMESYSELKGVRVDCLYLDTTYCHPSYDFPSQEATVQFALSMVKKVENENGRTLFVCGSYTIGKEKIFKAIAKELGCKVAANPQKLKILSCLEDSFIAQNITSDWTKAQVHVLTMQELTLQKLAIHLQKYKHHFTNIVAFKPTGWEYKYNTSLPNVKPRCSAGVMIYGIPYSEHSSFIELKRFVQFVRPRQIIPTVNVGKPEERARMQQLFHNWLK